MYTWSNAGKTMGTTQAHILVHALPKALAIQYEVVLLGEVTAMTHIFWSYVRIKYFDCNKVYNGITGGIK